MSTEPRTQAAFIQGKQSAVEHDPSHSALLYLFQEVSKLGSPVHSSFLDTHSTSTRLNETSRLDHFIVRREEEDAQSFSISNSSCQHSLTCLSPFNQVKKVKEEGLSSSVTILDEPRPECNSPWKVLGLINLQCERLLNPHDVVESDLSSVSSVAKVSDSLDNASTSIADETDHKTFVLERHKIQAGVSPRKDVTGVCSGGADRYKPQDCVNDSQMSCCAQSQTAEKTDTFRTEQVEEHAAASSQPRHRDTKWDKFSVSRHLRWNQECKDRLSSERDTENVSVYALLPFNSKEETSTALSKPAPSLDHNANFIFTPQPKTDTQLPQLSSVLSSSQPASFLFATAEHFHSLSNQNDKIIATKPECLDGPVEEKSPPVAQLNSLNYNGDKHPAHSATSELESGPVQEKEIALPSTQQWRTKTPRKQRHPSRSADIQDPDFQGVTFRMDTELDDSKEQCRLLITSKYSKELCRSVRKPRLRTRTAPKFLKTSSSDEENDPTTSSSKSKVCASCCTRKTPMWRDAEDGTPLCNACGIRYKKYRVRCVNCWHIPRKESNSNSCCPKCGNFVKLTSAQRKHSA